jgi:hypothetical protein
LEQNESLAIQVHYTTDRQAFHTLRGSQERTTKGEGLAKSSLGNHDSDEGEDLRDELPRSIHLSNATFALSVRISSKLPLVFPFMLADAVPDIKLIVQSLVFKNVRQ